MTAFASWAEIELVSSFHTDHLSQPQTAKVLVRDLADLTKAVLVSGTWLLLDMMLGTPGWLLLSRVVSGNTIGRWSEVPAGAWSGKGASV